MEWAVSYTVLATVEADTEDEAFEKAEALKAELFQDPSDVNDTEVSLLRR